MPVVVCADRVDHPEAAWRSRLAFVQNLAPPVVLLDCIRRVFRERPRALAAGSQ